MMPSILIGAIIAPTLTLIIGIIATYLISRKDREKIIAVNRENTQQLLKEERENTKKIVEEERRNTERILKEERKTMLAMVYAVSRAIKENREMTLDDVARGFQIADKIFKEYKIGG